MHNGPFNEPASLGIPGLIFQAKVTKFGTKVGLKMFISINSRYFHNQQKKILASFFHILQFRIRQITVSALTSINFHRSF